mmetsp:Transcript_17327/g.52737  ORF Transcript_17327/g.52737 Transcript_17327/m.52737 type:complete len:263 (-) Transcript_17327:19-807(-)
MSVLGAERQNWISAIFAFSTRVGPPAAFFAPWPKTMPFTNSVSSTVPPTCLTILMSFKSTVVSPCVASPKIDSTASTAIGANVSEFCDTTFDDRHVVTASTRVDRSLRSTGSDDACKIVSASFSASTKASAMDVGCMPFASSWEHASNSDPATTHTDVVPSPASMSCDFDNSTSIFAVGCATSISLRIVAPSFVMSTPLSSFWIILSMPRGPKDVLIVSAIAFAAIIFDIRTSFSFFSPRCVSPRCCPAVDPDESAILSFVA